MLSDSLQCSFYCCYFYFTETLDNFLQTHACTHMSSVSTLTIRWNLSGLFLPCTSYYYFIAIINNYYSSGVMFKWCQSDRDVASRKTVRKESKARKSYTNHFKNEKGVWSDRQVRLEEISYNLDWVPSPQPLTFSLACVKLVLCTVRVYFHTRFLRVEARRRVSRKGEEMLAKHAVKFKIYNSPRHLESWEASNAITGDCHCQESTKLD